MPNVICTNPDPKLIYDAIHYRGRRGCVNSKTNVSFRYCGLANDVITCSQTRKYLSGQVHWYLPSKQIVLDCLALNIPTTSPQIHDVISGKCYYVRYQIRKNKTFGFWRGSSWLHGDTFWTKLMVSDWHRMGHFETILKEIQFHNLSEPTLPNLGALDWFPREYC